MTAHRSVGKRQLAQLAARYVWWQSPAQTLRSPPALLCQILRLGTADDYVLARCHWGEAAFRAALANAPPGAIDERSWVFWHRQYRLTPRAFPRRSFG
jgi:hypothetical protein